MNEKHGIGFKGPQYRIYAPGRLRPPKLECDFAKPREFVFDAANVFDDSKHSSSKLYRGDRAVLSMPGIRVGHPKSGCLTCRVYERAIGFGPGSGHAEEF
jgi:hypothetical protein